MACFVAPATVAVVTTVARKVVQKKEADTSATGSQTSTVRAGGKWAQRLGSFAGNDRALKAAALSDGSLVVTGSVNSPAEFGPNGGTHLQGAGLEDAFVVRYYPQGQVAWVRNAGGAQFDEGRDVAAFADGSSLVVGVFSDLSHFGPGEIYETPLLSQGDLDAFIAHYGFNGDL